MTGTGPGDASTTADGRAERGSRLAAAGALAGALLASSCCVVPLVLFFLGVSGAWIGNLTVLEPYKPIFLIFTAGFLGYGYYHVYFRSAPPCEEDGACARPVRRRLVRVSLWIATLLAAFAFSFDGIAPLLLG